MWGAPDEQMQGAGVPGQPLPALPRPACRWARTDLAVPASEAVGAVAVVLAASLLTRASVPAGPGAAQARPGCQGQTDRQAGRPVGWGQPPGPECPQARASS